MIKYLKLFFKRISKDFAQKELLPLKLLFFIHASTVFVIYPYLTIHMRELGINVEETAIMSGITPVVAILMPPIAGMVADKIGNFKLLLAFFSAAGGASALLFLIVPVGRVTLSFPNQVVLGLSCQANGSVGISVIDEFPCTPQPYSSNETQIKIEACGFICDLGNGKNITGDILKFSDDYTISGSTILNYTVHHHVPTQRANLPSAYQPLKSNSHFTDSVRDFGRNSAFFPRMETIGFSCHSSEPQEMVTYNVTLPKEIELKDYFRFSCFFGERNRQHNILEKKILIGYSKMNSSIETQNYKLNYIKQNETMFSPSCVNSYSKEVTINVEMEDNRNHSDSFFVYNGCMPTCIATSLRTKFCSNQDILVEIDTKLTFWSYLTVRVVTHMISGTAFAMFEGAVIAILREHKADYGLQRIYAAVGGMISSPLAGWLIDFASRGKGYTDYRSIFFLYAALKIVSAVLMLFMNLEFKTPSSNVLDDVFTVLKDIELITLFIVSFILGTAWGFIESFLFWLIQDLGGSKSLMGITITVGGIAGIPLLVLSGPIIKRIGHANVLLIGFVFYAIRLLGYSLIYNPWLCLIFEAMESITSSLSFTAAVTYAAKLSSVTTDTSVQGMLGGIYYGVGKGTGSLIGGYSIKIFGTRTTYRIFSAATALTGVLYFLFNHFYIRKHKQKKESEKLPEKKNNIDMETKAPSDDVSKCIESIIKDDALPYEDALTNYGYEGDMEDEEPPKKKEDVEGKPAALPP